MEINQTKIKGAVVLNILNKRNVELNGKILTKIFSMIKKINPENSRIALNLENVKGFFAPEILTFLRKNNLSVLIKNPEQILALSLANKGVLPPIYLSLEDFLSKKRQFVKRNFYIV